MIGLTAVSYTHLDVYKRQERYIVVGVLCYTSPLAFSMGASKATTPVFRSWCRMVGSQLLLLVMNVWFLRGFSTSVGQYVGNGGALSNGRGSIFLWLFCAVAFLKTAQKFDSYLAAMGLNVAQTGSGMGMEPVAYTHLALQQVDLRQVLQANSKVTAM